MPTIWYWLQKLAQQFFDRAGKKYLYKTLTIPFLVAGVAITHRVWPSPHDLVAFGAIMAYCFVAYVGTRYFVRELGRDLAP